LFADGVNYNKSSSKTIWALLSSIVELPQLLRESHENIIAHSLWSGSNPDFNVFLECYNKQTSDLLEKGLNFRGRNIRFKIHFFCGDAPAICKICKSIQFNGKFGCIKCLHPSFRLNKTTIYPYMKDIPLRSNKIYENQVKKCIEIKEPFEGIKDESFLSLWLNIPDDIHREYMHASLIGSFKKMFCYPLISTNHTKSFYIGKNIFFLKNILFKNQVEFFFNFLICLRFG